MGEMPGVDYQNLQSVKQNLESRYNLFERNRRDKQKTIPKEEVLGSRTTTSKG